MSTENKYFTPSIEDIRVGYECEYKNRKNWVKTVLIDPEIIRTIAFDSLTLYNNRNKYLLEGIIRVPYLTKEQIKAEGWKFEYGLTDHMYFSKGRCQLIWFGPGKSIEIQNPANLPTYIGECKDINTFRYITKLLGI